MKTTLRRFLPGSLAGIACALCCVIPIRSATARRFGSVGSGS